MLTLNYCGYDVKNPDRDTILRPHGSGDWLFLYVQAEMTFYLPDGPARAMPGACLLYAPGMPQHYQAEALFLNSFAHFSAAPRDAALLAGLTVGQLFYPAPEELHTLHDVLRRLQSEFFTPAAYGAEMQHTLLAELLTLLHRAKTQQRHGTAAPRPWEEEIARTRFHMLAYCEQAWDAARLCESVHLSKSQFYACYQAIYHTTPKAELLHARLERAKNLLTNESLQVQQVARLCGFASVCHFNRYFQAACGCSPREYVRRGHM
ncbi:MAG: helix-turn-helix transcriptional regulator [Faecalibacterium sp.]|nr:helix-turn-helix transcriptional regulator [Faecalibacterium sp.]